MDIRFHEIEAGATERAAVDSVLGPPVSAWAGGVRDTETEGHSATFGGHAARSQRDLLLPVLHAVQRRFGWLPPAALNYISRRLTLPPAEVFGVATFYHLFSLTPSPPGVIHVCDDIACRIKGAERLCSEMESISIPQFTWKRSPCLGLCERAPAVMVSQAGENPRLFSQGPVSTTAEIISAANSLNGKPEGLESLRRSVPQAGQEDLRLIRRIGRVQPESLEAYQADGGYVALKKALELGPEGVIREVLASNLLGRGGAAFPTGRKWEAVARAPARPHYVVCNADESEPGTFKDRLLMEGDPFGVIEGITIAAYATGSERGYFYVRGEYPLAAHRIGAAIENARAAGLLGENILGSGFAFDIELRSGAGAYICGEETALFNSIEGKRGEPRNKPPFPVHVGLFGKPTLINNVETLANIPLIIAAGGAAYAGVGTSGSSGPKLFCVSGHVVRPGLYEIPFGRTLRELIDMAGGVPEGKGIRAILLGGAAGMFIGPDKLDVPLTFEGTRAIGATLGSGVVLIFDETVDLADILTRVAAFFRDESCGQCVPCRVGTVRQEELLSRLRSGRTIGSRSDELALLKEIGQAMRDASICGLGQTASNAIESALANLNPIPGGKDEA
ncbi:MAG TPA: NAD(P)H-dependent oxidoreductase subunit E [Terriglobia bacterium]|nr:NAD(P)H-dependent oxidoreductase subunit E [Terriglobia bacterium]